MDETAIYDLSSVSKFNRNPEPLTTGHLHNSKKYKSTCKMRNEIETKRSEIETKFTETFRFRFVSVNFVSFR